MRGRAVVDVAPLRLREMNGPSLTIRDVRPLSFGIGDAAHRRKPAVRKKGPRKFWIRAHRNNLNRSQTDSAASLPLSDCAAYRLGRRSPGHLFPKSQALELLSSGNRRLRQGQPDTKSASALLSLLRNPYAIEPCRTLLSGYNYKDLRMSAL
jgi:hypothetical protein